MSHDPLNQLLSIERAATTQGGIGGTNYDWDNADIVVYQFLGSIQTAKPQFIEDWARRGVQITSKIYTKTDVSAARLGDRIQDPRYGDEYGAGAVYYIVKYVEDLAGMGVNWGIWCERTH